MKRFLFCSVLLITCACSVLDSTPTIEQARARIEAQLARETPHDTITHPYLSCMVPNGVILANIHKTDGQSSERDGVKRYDLFYEGEFEFTKDGRADNAETGVVLLNCPPGFFTRVNATFYNQLREVRKGQREKFKGDMDFETTENGWQPYGIADFQIVE
jgi:hypothetical protein